VPLTVWMEIDKNGEWGDPVELEDNDNLQSTINDVKWPTREFNSFKSDKYEKRKCF